MARFVIKECGDIAAAQKEGTCRNVPLLRIQHLPESRHGKDTAHKGSGMACACSPAHAAEKRKEKDMKITVLTMFPDAFASFLRQPVTERAVRKGSLTIHIVDIKEYSEGSYRRLDDSTYGGGAGMVMRCKPVLTALRAVDPSHAAHRILLSPAGIPYTQEAAHRLSGRSIWYCSAGITRVWMRESKDMRMRFFLLGIIF